MPPTATNEVPAAAAAASADPCEIHEAITGPNFPNLKLPDGTDAPEKWYVPYQNHNLPANLKNIEHPVGSGSYVDCNPGVHKPKTADNQGSLAVGS